MLKQYQTDMHLDAAAWLIEQKIQGKVKIISKPK